MLMEKVLSHINLTPFAASKQLGPTTHCNETKDVPAILRCFMGVSIWADVYKKNVA